MHRRLRLALALALTSATLAATACGGDDLGPPPELADVGRVVIVGDNGAANPSFHGSFAALLVANDDDAFPAFAGKDLATLLGSPEVVRLERGGDSYHALASLAEPVCSCGSPCADAGPCVDSADETPTLVVVELGFNDVFDAVIQIVLDFFLADDPQPVLDQLRAEVQLVLATINDSDAFGTRPLIAVVNPYDPSDGVGDLAAVAKMFYPPLDEEAVSIATMNRVLDGFETILREETAAVDGVFVDVKAHFLGHGYHYDDTANPNHDAADATIWMQQLFDPNPRGAHEMRRVIWNQLTGESITALPSGVPPGDELVLPAVPDEGWANAIPASDITSDFDAEERNWVNVATDTSVAIGPPGEGTSSAVAVGIVGAWLVADLGEGEEAFDGPGTDIVVMELGAMTGGAPEPYRVLVSDAVDGPWTILTDGRGERAYDLAPAGVASARYVRIESQAHIPDVMSGFGSPLYPGPEINAVGAVYPGSAP